MYGLMIQARVLATQIRGVAEPSYFNGRAVQNADEETNSPS
jgi:hypothetical protein